MPEYHSCPFLGGDVEVTEERYSHVLAGHSDLALCYWERVAETLVGPNRVLRSNSWENGTLFLRHYDDLNKMVVAIVITDPGRYWLITAYITGNMPRGEILWERN